MQFYNTELFFVPYKGKHVLFNPLSDEVFLVNGFEKAALEKSSKKKQLNSMEAFVVDFYRNKFAFNNITHQNTPTGQYLPLHVTFLPTNDCNLACVYCYSRGGEKKQYLSFEKAVKAVDFVFVNAAKQGKKHFTLDFLGGGEPSLNWELIVRLTEYASRKAEDAGFNLELRTITNGLLSRKQIDWLTEKNFKLCISFDGMPCIQNAQRPLAYGSKPSFDLVYRTIRRLDDKNYSYHLQCVVTENSVDLMLENFEFFCNKTNFNSLGFIPVFGYGRSKDNRIELLSIDKFKDNFLKIKRLGEEKGKKITFNKDLFKRRINLRNCPVVYGVGCVITPDGFISMCPMVDSSDHALAGYFVIGQFSKDGKAWVSLPKINRLMKRAVNNIPRCKNCFAKYNCSAGCPAIAIEATNKLLGVNEFDCKINKAILRQNIIAAVEQRLSIKSSK